MRVLVILMSHLSPKVKSILLISWLSWLFTYPSIWLVSKAVNLASPRPKEALGKLYLKQEKFQGHITLNITWKSILAHSYFNIAVNQGEILPVDLVKLNKEVSKYGVNKTVWKRLNLEHLYAAEMLNVKNPAYRRHWISRPMRIVAPIPKQTEMDKFFLRGGGPIWIFFKFLRLGF